MTMPLIVKVLAEDLVYWRLENRTARFYHYRPAWEGEAPPVQLVSPEPLAKLVGKDMLCFIGVQKGWLSRKLGERPEVKLQLRRPGEPIRDPRRVRLRCTIDWKPGLTPNVRLEDIDVRANSGLVGDPDVPDSQS